MSSKATLNSRRTTRYLRPTFPSHLTFSPSPGLRASTRNVPHTESIHAAALAGDVIGVSLFIKDGVDVNAIDSVGDAPIHYACISKHPNQNTIVEILLAHGANPLILTITGQTVLHLLVVHSKSPSTLSTLRRLVESGGVDINMQDEIKRTPLQYFLRRYHTLNSSKLEDIVKFLILNGAKVEGNWVNVVRDEYTLAYIIECLTLENGGFNTESSKIKSFVASFEHRGGDDSLKLLHKIQHVIMRAETLYRTLMLVWGQGASCISSWEFLNMSERSISDLAKKEPLLYFSLRQHFPASSSSLRQCSHPLTETTKFKQWKILYRHYLSQFNTFCYYFVKEQLNTVNFTSGRVTLNYDCIRILSSFLNLKDLVNLCEAFNFKDMAVDTCKQGFSLRQVNDPPIYEQFFPSSHE